MKTGILCLVLRRAAIFRGRSTLHTEVPWVAHVHAAGFDPGLGRPVPMFSRAVEKGVAAVNNPPRPSTSGNVLAKQLFPSSSPAPSSSNTQAHSGNVADMLRKPRVPSGSNAPSKPPSAADPLQNRSLNTSQPPPPRVVNNKAFASLYNTADSFKESPVVINLLDGTPTASTSSKSNTLQNAVYISDDDFSDDENLDLDFQAPSILPSLPSLPHSQYCPPPPASKHDPPPASNTSALSWSQSSPSHHGLPKRQADTISQRRTKRESPVDDLPLQATKKPRQLYWKSRQAADEEELSQQSKVVPPVATKSKGGLQWNSTASEIAARKKQLKTQQKVAVPGSKDASASDMRDAVKSYAAAKAATTIMLSKEQRHVKTLVVENGQSVFFTGPAGTGKSVLMRAIIGELKKKFARDPEKIAVTASTGLAACNIGGMTLHSFAGIGLGKEDAATLVKKIRRNPKAKNRWLKTKVLVVDEISMVDGDLFDKLSQIGRTIRNNGRPWGGIQLVITGDFFQLPPVPDGSKQREAKFAFDAATWTMSIDHTIGLTEVFRQKDPEFADMLNEMRLGRISEQTVRNFQALSRPLQFNDGLEVTELFPTRNEVESSNQKRLRALSGKPYRFDSLDTGDPAIRERLLANMMAPTAIELKKGAQVMLIKNMDETLVNGSLGTVIDFMSESTFENTHVDDAARSDADSDAKKRIRAFSNALSDSSSKKDNVQYPLVQFHAVDGTHRTILCVPEDWRVELPTGEVQASRKQLPLILAWALSIHKAQGQTLERVKVDLGKVFEKGQAYVALSRATTQEGLQVLRFQKEKVMAHPRVVGFYNKLYSAETAAKKKAEPATITQFIAPKVAPRPRPAAPHGGRDMFDEDEEAMAAYG